MYSSDIFCVGIFCLGIFCSGIFCSGIFCPGIFYLVTIYTYIYIYIYIYDAYMMHMSITLDIVSNVTTGIIITIMRQPIIHSQQRTVWLKNAWFDLSD